MGGWEVVCSRWAMEVQEMEVVGGCCCCCSAVRVVPARIILADPAAIPRPPIGPLCHGVALQPLNWTPFARITPLVANWTYHYHGSRFLTLSGQNAVFRSASGLRQMATVVLGGTDIHTCYTLNPDDPAQSGWQPDKQKFAHFNPINRNLLISTR